MRRTITLIVARADNGVIGRGGDLPWRLPEDLKHFKRLTVGKPVVMGRKTYESIGKPLPGRHNIVLTRQRGYDAPGCTLVPTLADALTAADPAEEIMIIGGAELYAQALPLADRIHLTEVHESVEGDTILPPLGGPGWREISRVQHDAQDGQPAYSFVTLERLEPAA